MDDIVHLPFSEEIAISGMVFCHFALRGGSYAVKRTAESYIPASIHNEAMLSGAWTSIAQ